MLATSGQALPIGLADWENHLNALNPNHIELGLKRVEKVRQQLFAQLNMPPVVLIAGTNGKGSSVALMQASLQAAGLRAGVYTSPHLLRLNERIAINSQAIADDDFVAALNAVEVARGEITLTYFEMLTLAAAYYFAVQRVDLALLEVGLGGRLDAVNVFDPCVSLITNIGLDHIDWLGDTRELIGREKAGVFRTNMPAIYADQDPVNSVLDAAKRLGIGLALYQPSVELPSAPLLPEVPDSIKWGALNALQCLPGPLRPNAGDCEQGFLAATLPGRFQTVCTRPLTLVDVAHNVDATTLLASKLRKHPEVKRWLAVFSAYADKDIDALLQPLAEVVDAWICCPLESSRAASVESLLGSLSRMSVDSRAAASVTAAWEQAAVMAGNSALPTGIIVFGSFETVAAAMRHLKH